MLRSPRDLLRLSPEPGDEPVAGQMVRTDKRIAQRRIRKSRSSPSMLAPFGPFGRSGN